MAKAKKTGKRKTARRRNVAQGFWAGGSFHPIRASKDYNEFMAGDFDHRDRSLKIEEMTLSQYVRHLGGIKLKDNDPMKGEINRLSRKESGSSGLVGKKGKKSLEYMMDACAEEGYSWPEGYGNPFGAFIEAVERDASGQKKNYHPESSYLNNPAMRKKKVSKSSKKNPAKGRKRAASGDLFGAGAVAAAKGARRVQRPETGAVGTVVGQIEKQGGKWLKVLFKGYDRPHLVHASELRDVNTSSGKVTNPGLKEYAVLANDKVNGAEMEVVRRARSAAAAIAKAKADFKKAGHNPATLTRWRTARNNPARRVQYIGKRKPVAKRNPRKVSKAVKGIYNEFQGRDSKREYSLAVPNGTPKDVATLGRLIEVQTAKHGVLRFNNNPAYLGSTAGRKLVIGLSRPYRINNPDGGAAVDLGEVKAVVYKTRKPHLDDGAVHEYIHKLGEEGGARPHLVLQNGVLSLKGGDYKITREGIRN